MKAQLERQYSLGAEKSELMAPNLSDKRISTETQKRGGCLSLLLGFYILGGALLILAQLIYFLLPDSNPSITPPFTVAVWQLIVGALDVVFGVAAWKWKRWGVFGLVATIAVSFLVGFSLSTFSNILFFVLPLVQIALLLYLVRQKWGLFE